MAASAKPTSTEVALTVGIEMLGVGVLTLIAGASDETGSITVLFMVGLWMIFLISDSSVLSSINNALSNVASQAS
jgi:hypothetical protein